MPISSTDHVSSIASLSAISVVCQESSTTRLPEIKNCRPVTSLASSLLSQTTAGDTFSGASRSAIPSGRMSSVRRDSAAGAKTLTVMFDFLRSRAFPSCIDPPSPQLTARLRHGERTKVRAAILKGRFGGTVEIASLTLRVISQ